MVVTERCKGCGRCVAACPGRLLTLETAGEQGMGRKTARLSGGCCTGCGRCAEACPYEAILIQSPTEKI